MNNMINFEKAKGFSVTRGNITPLNKNGKKLNDLEYALGIAKLAEKMEEKVPYSASKKFGNEVVKICENVAVLAKENKEKASEYLKACFIGGLS